MKMFFAAALAAVAAASTVHEFFAESNYICELCKTAVEFEKQGNEQSLDRMYEIFPALLERITAFAQFTDMNLVYDENDAVGTCQRLDLCEKFDVVELLMGEEQIDFTTHIETVNNSNSNWVAGVNAKFEGATRSDIKQIMGTVVDPAWTVPIFNLAPEIEFNGELPTNFDTRTNWPKCESVVNHVRDQANCGSCWAHGTTEAFNDRKCISTDGAFTKLLSVADTTGCCGFIQCQSMGCNGGQVGTPWKWFDHKGVVTGGDFGDDDGVCYDYTMPQCAHHVAPTPTMKSCDDIPQVAPQCESTCVSDPTIDYMSDKNKAKTSYGFGRDAIEKIKQDIYTYGTVTGAFTVYEDFPTYKSGVYRHTTGKALGGHAIKVIGWGVENGDDYWLCVNSWNNTWGDHGLFKILMGDCGMDNQMHAGLV